MEIRKKLTGGCFMYRETEDKAERILSIYSRIRTGKIINKSQEAERFGVSLRTIQRDVADIQNFLQNQESSTGEIQEIVFDKAKNGYRLETKRNKNLEAREILAAGKILLESRALVKTELFPIIYKLLELCSDEAEKKMVEDFLKNEMHHYIELRHGRKLLDLLLTLEQAVANQNYIRIRYQKMKNREIVERKVKPVGIMFSEFYFYMTAYIEGMEQEKVSRHPADQTPTIYRLDRIEEIRVLPEHFSVPYAERFEEGEFRKRIQFMYGGRLQKVKFRYYGNDPDSILDRIPTGKIISRDEDGITISAEVFGTGIDMWLRSQGELVERLD